jgi:hypothetical protein
MPFSSFSRVRGSAVTYCRNKTFGVEFAAFDVR